MIGRWLRAAATACVAGAASLTMVLAQEESATQPHGEADAQAMQSDADAPRIIKIDSTPRRIEMTPRQLEAVRDLAPLIICPGPFPKPIAFSAHGANHVGSGADAKLIYAGVVTNEGGGWSPTKSQFRAPCAGLYYFSWSFVKDAWLAPCEGGPAGGEDDVYVYLTKGATPISQIMAWSGEGDGRRGTGAASVVLRLAKGDVVATWSLEDGDQVRCVREFNFSGYRIAD